MERCKNCKRLIKNLFINPKTGWYHVDTGLQPCDVSWTDVHSDIDRVHTFEELSRDVAEPEEMFGGKVLTEDDISIHIEARCWGIAGCQIDEPHKHGVACTKTCIACSGECHRACPAKPQPSPGYAMYDHLSPEEAVREAWIREGSDPKYHHWAQSEVRRTMPLLARALNRLATEGK